MMARYTSAPYQSHCNVYLNPHFFGYHKKENGQSTGNITRTSFRHRFESSGSTNPYKWIRKQNGTRRNPHAGVHCPETPDEQKPSQKQRGESVPNTVTPSTSVLYVKPCTERYSFHDVSYRNTSHRQFYRHKSILHNEPSKTEVPVPKHYFKRKEGASRKYCSCQIEPLGKDAIHIETPRKHVPRVEDALDRSGKEGSAGIHKETSKRNVGNYGARQDPTETVRATQSNKQHHNRNNAPRKSSKSPISYDISQTQRQPEKACKADNSPDRVRVLSGERIETTGHIAGEYKEAANSEKDVITLSHLGSHREEKTPRLSRESSVGYSTTIGAEPEPVNLQPSESTGFIPTCSPNIQTCQGNREMVIASGADSNPTGLSSSIQTGRGVRDSPEEGATSYSDSLGSLTNPANHQTIDIVDLRTSSDFIDAFHTYSHMSFDRVNDFRPQFTDSFDSLDDDIFGPPENREQFGPLFTKYPGADWVPPIPRQSASSTMTRTEAEQLLHWTGWLKETEATKTRMRCEPVKEDPGNTVDHISTQVDEADALYLDDITEIPPMPERTSFKRKAPPCGKERFLAYSSDCTGKRQRSEIGDRFRSKTDHVVYQSTGTPVSLPRKRRSRHNEDNLNISPVPAKRKRHN